VDTELIIGGCKASHAVRSQATSSTNPPQLTLKHFLLLAAVAAVLIGVFSLSAAARADLGVQTGSHLRSLARAHRLAESEDPAIQIEHSAVRPVTVLAEPVLLGRLLPNEDGACKPVTAFGGSRISRAPPAQVTA
jgi:hypothetical protein